MSGLSAVGRKLTARPPPVPEVVLATLLPTFAFELTEQEITWNFSAVNYPTMGEESPKPEMLLKVKVL